MAEKTRVYTRSAVTQNEQTTCDKPAVTADDNLQTDVFQDKLVVCLREYWKKGVQFLDDVRNKEFKIPGSAVTKMKDQGRQICKDYIYHKLAEKDMSGKLNFGGYNSIHSHHYITTGHLLEKMHPRVYSDVSRKIGRTMSSAGIVKAILNDVLNILFKDSITWGKIVSMFAIASCFAEECVQQGHPRYVTAVLDTVSGFVDTHLAEWLVRHGGWKGIDCAHRESKETVNPTYVIGIVGAAVGVFAVTTSLLLHLT